MIITFTANPSLDRTVTLDKKLIPGEVHRITSDQTQVGGKGINVALGLQRASIPNKSVFPAPRHSHFLSLLEKENLTCHVSHVSQEVRTNLTIISPPGITTKINEPGAGINKKELQTLENTLIENVSANDTVMLSGSLSPGMPTNEYATLVRTLKRKGAWVGVDTSDQALHALAKEMPEAAPHFMKPNSQELGQLTDANGSELEKAAYEGNLESTLQAATLLHKLGVEEILVTLGGAGALLVTGKGAWYTPAHTVTVKSTVGAGDSATAGYLIARHEQYDPPTCLAFAAAYGSAAVASEGTTIPARKDVHVDTSTIRRL